MISSILTAAQVAWSAVSSRRLNERGASMVEYALLVVLIALIAIVAVTVAGKELSENYSVIASGIEGANNAAN